MSGVVSLPNRLRLMNLNAKKMTPLWPFRIMKNDVLAIVRTCADMQANEYLIRQNSNFCLP